MAQRKTLTLAQIDVLRWVADGCPEEGEPDYHRRISVGALKRRGLVTTKGRGQSWSAAITEDGRDYLAKADSPQAPEPRQGNVSVTQQLVDDLIAAGGSLTVARADGYPGRVDFRRRAEMAERHGKVPPGKRIVVSSLGYHELKIELVDAPVGTYREVAPVPVPERVAKYHSAVAAFRDDKRRHEVSRALLPRALLVMQALAIEAERRGYTAATVKDSSSGRYHDVVWSGPTHGHIAVEVDGVATALRVFEEGLGTRSYFAERDTSFTRGPGAARSTPALAEYERGATGRLALAVVSYPQRSWADRKRWKLKDKLPEVLREIEVRAAEERHRQREAEARRQAEQRRWQEELGRARERHYDQRRIDAITAESDAWRRAEQIRAYCDAVVARYGEDEEPAEWVAWARDFADRLDPLSDAPRMPAPADRLSETDLRPFLDPHLPPGW